MSAGKEPAMRSLHLLYHELTPVPQAYSYSIATQLFAEHLELCKELQASTLQPKITFDDGHISNYNYALPLLEHIGMKAQFFITAGWIGDRENYMGWTHVQALHRAGHTIGAHGWSHALLTQCSTPELKRELTDARALLEDKLGAAVTSLSFPGGRFNRKVLRACEDAGYSKLYTSVPHAEPLPEGTLIGRLNIRGDVSTMWLNKLFTDDGETLRKLELQDKVKGGAKKLLGDRMYASLWAKLNRADAEVL